MKIGIIGSGNMGSAIIKGIVNNKLTDSTNIYVYDKDNSKTTKLKEELGINVSPEPKDLISNIDTLILAVKPNVSMDVFKEIKGYLTNEVIISIMAGITINTIEKSLGSDKKIVRVMPNTPALVNEAMSGFSINKNITDKDLEEVQSILNSFGKAELIDEALMDVVTGISGSSPAYVFIMIEAMADAAVKEGLSRDKAYKFISQAILGSAKMVRDLHIHPGELKDMVTSPAGTTIEGVKALEENNFRYALMEAVKKATKRSRELGKK